MTEIEDILVGSLDVKSTPSGAKIYIDNIYQKVETPCMINNIPEGEYVVKLELERYEIKEEQIYIEYIKVVYVDTLLTAIPEDTGTINITSNPIGASVYLDNIDTETETPIILSNIQPGYYLITLTKDGYNDIVNSVDVEANKVSYIDVELELSYVKFEISHILAAGLILGICFKLMINKSKHNIV